VQDEDSLLRGFYVEQRKIEPSRKLSEERHSTAQNEGVNLEPVVVDQVCLCQGRNQLPTAEDQQILALLLLELGNGLSLPVVGQPEFPSGRAIKPSRLI